MKYLVPAFLRKIDAYLLLHYPILWETKIVFVLFYSLIVANLALVGAGMLVPISKQYIPAYDAFTSNTLVWTGILAGLAIGYYAYQQSFIRIKTYTMRQNALRWGIYAVAVTSIMSNLLVLPHTVISRVRTTYTAEEIQKDKATLQKMDILKDYVYMIHKANVEDKDKILAQLQNSSLNAKGDVDALYQTCKTFDKWVNAEGLTGKKYHELIENQPNWHPALKRNLMLQTRREEYSDGRTFSTQPFELNTHTISAIYAKYPEQPLQRWKRYSEDINILDNIKRVEQYFRANTFLVTKFPSRYDYGLPNGNQEYISLSNLVFDFGNTNLIKEKRASHEWQNLKDVCFSAEYKDVVKLRTAGEVINRFDPKLFYFANKLILDTERVNSLAYTAIPKSVVSPYTLEIPYTMAVVLLSLFVLIAKTLNLRSLFVAGLGLMASFFAVSATIIFVLIPVFGKYMTHGFMEFEHYGTFVREMLTVSFFGMLILFISGLFSLYVLRYKAHKKWFETLWVYFLSGGLVLNVLWFALGLAGYLGNFNQTLPSINATIFYTGFYAIFAFAMFGMYCAYNNMMNYPLKK